MIAANVFLNQAPRNSLFLNFWTAVGLLRQLYYSSYVRSSQSICVESEAVVSNIIRGSYDE